MKGSWRLRLGVLLIPCSLALLAGCQRLPPTPAGIRPDIRSAQDLRARLLVRAQAIRSFKAKGRVFYISPEQKYNGTALLQGYKPQTLRVDVINFWGQSALTFFTNGPELQIMDYRQGKLYRGPATPRNLADFLPPVKIAELLEVLTGGVLLPPKGTAQMTFITEKDQYRLEITAEEPETRTILWVDAQNLRILTAQWLDVQSQRSFKVKFDDFDYRHRYPLPQQITLISGDSRRDLRLHYRELILNPPLTLETLSLVVPATVQEVPFSQ